MNALGKKRDTLELKEDFLEILRWTLGYFNENVDFLFHVNILVFLCLWSDIAKCPKVTSEAHGVLETVLDQMSSSVVT